MNFTWADYIPEYAVLVDSWLDDTAIKMTGIEDGFDEEWRATLDEAKNFPGCKDFCKIVSQNGVPFAAVKYGYYQDNATVSVIIVDPAQRGKGRGSAVLRELVANTNTLVGEKVDKFDAVIFPSNASSQKAFEKAGFLFDYAHEDGDALYYTFKVTENE